MPIPSLLPLSLVPVHQLTRTRVCNSSRSKEFTHSKWTSLTSNLSMPRPLHTVNALWTCSSMSLVLHALSTYITFHLGHLAFSTQKTCKSSSIADLIGILIGIYFDWDNKRFHEMTAEDFVSHFNVNTMVSKHPTSALLWVC